MNHIMKLSPSPFKKIKEGRKTIELRLYDEKRQQLKKGDRIDFIHAENKEEQLSAKVEELFVFSSFEELYRTLPLTECGYEKENVVQASPKDMEEYYSEEQQKQYGVVGIKISLLQK